MKVTDRKRLWALSGGVCGFPDCGVELAGNPGADKVLGEEAHIKGEKLGAARYDPAQCDEERDGYDNRILLCPTHHTMVDSNETQYTVMALGTCQRG
jgi:hypothetical protein